jgi:ribonuclease G
LGIVKNILPGQFVFIDIGAEKNAFMNIAHGHSFSLGSPILVQVRKDSFGSKGPCVTEQLVVSGRLAIIYKSPGVDCGVSRKITEKRERARLRKIALETLPAGYGVIMRTNSARRDEAEITEELAKLVTLHTRITDRARYAKPPITLHEQNPLLNDLLSDDIAELWVNDAARYEEVRRAVQAAAPELAERVLFYRATETDQRSLFDAYGVESQILRALQKRVWLPCGGFVTFEQTEACVVVDVNTGKFSDGKNARSTVLRTNMEAAACVAAQLPLRNLSGMIIVDFIDMRMEEDKVKLSAFFAEELTKDRIPTYIVGMTELGLMQLTRKKMRPPLASLLELECPRCLGSGRIRRDGTD